MIGSLEKIRAAVELGRRLQVVAAELERRERLASERRWMMDALALLAERTAGAEELLVQAAALPDAEPLRKALELEARERWIQRAEALHRVLARTFGPRAPVVEAIFPHTDFDLLHRKGFGDFHDAVLRCLGTTYVERTLAEEERVHTERDALVEATERLALLREPAAPADETALRLALDDAAAPLDLVLLQVKHLAQAALLPAPDLLERAALEQKRRRQGRKTTVRAGAGGR